MLLMQQRRNFEATYRTYCYASAVALFSWIPFVGWITSLYGLYVLVVGLREVHGNVSEAASPKQRLPRFERLSLLTHTLIDEVDENGPPLQAEG